MAANKLKNFEGLSCMSGECPWQVGAPRRLADGGKPRAASEAFPCGCSQALLKSSESGGFCSGVILKKSLVLTSAQCARKYGSFQVAVGE